LLLPSFRPSVRPSFHHIANATPLTQQRQRASRGRILHFERAAAPHAGGARCQRFRGFRSARPAHPVGARYKDQVFTILRPLYPPYSVRCTHHIPSFFSTPRLFLTVFDLIVVSTIFHPARPSGCKWRRRRRPSCVRTRGTPTSARMV
jgi:hypothetical protein